MIRFVRLLVWSILSLHFSFQIRCMIVLSPKQTFKYKRQTKNKSWTSAQPSKSAHIKQKEYQLNQVYGMYGLYNRCTLLTSRSRSTPLPLFLVLFLRLLRWLGLNLSGFFLLFFMFHSFLFWLPKDKAKLELTDSI